MKYAQNYVSLEFSAQNFHFQIFGSPQNKYEAYLLTITFQEFLIGLHKSLMMSLSIHAEARKKGKC